MRGQTPAQALREALGVADLPPIVPENEEIPQPEAEPDQPCPVKPGVGELLSLYSLTTLPDADLPASSHSVPPRGAALLNPAKETDIERLRQAALLLGQENARLFQRLKRLAGEPEQRLVTLAALRAEQSKPVLDEIRTWLMTQRALPRSALGKAIA